MFKPLRLSNSLIKIFSSSLVDLPTPSNLSILWNFGSLLGLCLIIQVLTGIFLSMHYAADTLLAFSSISHICKDVNYGWLMRVLHANGASLFFVCIYLHIGRGLYYGSYKNYMTWMVGVILIFLTMATAFLGYVLPWGQMSFWGATVITNLLSAIPYFGLILVNWVWGGFSIDNPTLSRFFTLHFILPFILIGLTMIHLLFLHSSGSGNPLGLNSEVDKIPFHPYFSVKDIMGFVIMFSIFILLNLTEPYKLSDPDNFSPANPLVTPVHIQPEWYFLFAYAILRAIPNKLGGVMALFFSILMLIFPLISINSKFKGLVYYPLSQFLFWMFISTVLMLTWIGSCPVEYPYMNTGLLLTVVYFMYFIVDPMMMLIWDKLLY